MACNGNLEQMHCIPRTCAFHPDTVKRIYNDGKMGGSRIIVKFFAPLFMGEPGGDDGQCL